MQNNRLPALAQLNIEDFQGPDSDAVPASPDAPAPAPADALDINRFLGPEDTEPADPQPVIKPDLTPREWVMSTLSNVIPSAMQNVGDMLSLIRPLGKRAGGDTTLIPGIADLARLAAESQYKGAEGVWNPVTRGIALAARGYTELDERLFGGIPQTGGETPMFDAFADYITGRYDFSKPEVRAAFSEVVREDPVGVLTDLMVIPSIALGGGGAAAKAAATTTKVSARMAKVLGGAQKANQLVNHGFHIGGVPGKVLGKVAPSRITPRGFQVRTGLADIADPGVWALRGGVRGVTAGTDLARKGYAATFAPRRDADVRAKQDQQARLARQGFTDEPLSDDAVVKDYVTEESVDGIFTPLSLMTGSERMMGAEAGRYDKEFAPVREAVERTETQFNTRVEEILSEAHTDGDLERAATALSEQYRVSREQLIKESEAALRGAGGEPGLVVDMRPVHTLLQDLKAQDERLARLGTDLDDEYTPFAGDAELQRIDEHVTALADQNQNMLTADFLSETPDRAPTTPVVRSETASTPKVEDELYGTPTRQSLDTNTGRTYATTYRVMDLYDIITSHIVEVKNALIARDNPDFDKTLQVKDMKLPSQLKKVWDIARNLFPDHILGGNRTIQAGTPIIDQRDMSISGNHRLEALRVAIVAFPEKAQAYQDRIPAEMDRFGLTTDTSQMGFPVLVRVLDDDVDLQQFARAGNVAEQSMLGETAQATQDLHIVDDDLLTLFNAGDGQQAMADVIRSTENADFRQRFIGKLSSSEQAQFVGRGEEISKRGEARITNALTAKVFDGQFGAALRGIFTEGASAGFRNIQRGIQNALPALLRLRESGADYNIAEPMAEAILKLEDFRENQKTGKGVQAAINTYLDNTAEGGLFDALDETDSSWQVRDLDEKGRALLRVLAVGVDKRTMLTNFIREYVETVRQSSDDIPAEEILDTIASKYIDAYEKGVSDDLKQGLNALFQYADEADADAAAARTAQETPPEEPPPTEAPRVVEPVLLEDLVAYRDALQSTLDSGHVGPRLREWRTQLVNALDTAINSTLMDAADTPGMQARVQTAQQDMQRTHDTLNTSFAKLLDDLLSGTRNPNDPAVVQAMETVFTPKDTISTIENKYNLMGGFNSDAAKRVRRIFLAKLFDFTRTDAGRGDARAVAQGERPLGDVSTRYNPEGIRKYMNQFVVSMTDYDDSTLRVILGSRTVDDLHDLDGILQAFGKFMKRTGSDEKFFGDQVRGNMVSRIMNTLGGRVAGVGGLGGILGGASGGLGGAISGAIGAVTLERLLTGASNIAFDRLYMTPDTRQAMLDGLELSLRESWGRGLRVLERGTARTARTASKREEE